MKFKFLFFLAIIMGLSFITEAQQNKKHDSFLVGQTWYDTNGDTINAHGGNIIFYDNNYYWFGEKRSGHRSMGVNVYSSNDLYNWKPEGLALSPSTDTTSDIAWGGIMERPKVVFNKKTGKFAMWFHVEVRGRGYGAAQVGVAESDRITGPYRFVRSFRPNGNMSRDMTIFVDDDGSAYEIYSSRENYDLRIVKLTDDYLNVTTKDSLMFSAHREAPAIFKRNNKYYLITSACTGWSPNEAVLRVADNLYGEWKPIGNPMRGNKSSTTFDGQPAFIFPIANTEDKFIYVGDKWNPRNLTDSRYHFLPIKIEGENIHINWHDQWNLDKGFDLEYSITNVRNRNTTSLNGKWQYIMDPYETGFFDYRYKELSENNPSAYWNSDVPRDKSDLKEFGYNDNYTLNVPGDWNHQDGKFLYYEGTVWYKKSFDYTRKNGNSRVFLYFGAVNYRADVYLNGKKLGAHVGGFTPFDFEIPADLLKEKDNYLVVRVNNTRHADDVPTLNTDWWNYGGITRNVLLVEIPESYIQDFTFQLDKKESGFIPTGKKPLLSGWIQLSQKPSTNEKVTVSIPELKYEKQFDVTSQRTNLEFSIPSIQLWSPENPKLYNVSIIYGQDTLSDKIGFRTIEAYKRQVLLNGKPIFMKGIALHEEMAKDVRRAWSREDALHLLGQAKELGCNMVRLAHYPHDESMTRMADSMGILVWSEIPVYWTIDFGNDEVYQNAESQLKEMITRDRNRASVIVWSVGNETPVSKQRTNFMHSLINTAKALDDTRMISAALEVNYNSGKNVNLIDDPLSEFVDLVAFNEYLGWYGGTPDKCRTANWATLYDKPLFISETGAGAKYGFHADSLTRFSEEYQAWYYREQINMLRRMPDNWVGMSPWVLADFRSPKRNNPVYQEGWNRKGLFDDKGNKKQAFYILQKFYIERQ